MLRSRLKLDAPLACTAPATCAPFRCSVRQRHRQLRLAVRADREPTPSAAKTTRPARRSRTTSRTVDATDSRSLPQSSSTVIVGDIGGTNARLSIWQVDVKHNQHEELFTEVYPTSEYNDFEVVLSDFLKEDTCRKHRPSAASLAVAGAVENNRCAMTNLSWVIDGAKIEQQFNFTTAVLNDFEAVGYGIPVLNSNDLEVVNPGEIKPRAPKVVMGPGTGLGAAQLVWDTHDNAYRVVPGEGAHGTFAPRGWKQQALARWVEEQLGHCEIEEVACGHGLEMIYKFLLSDEPFNRPTVLRNAEAKRAPAITTAALVGDDPLAVEAVDLFLAIVGAEAGAMALRSLAKGGVYIAGGIVPRMLDIVKTGGLRDAYLNPKSRERFHNILKEIPLFLVTNTKCGLIGSREYAIRIMPKTLHLV